MHTLAAIHLHPSISITLAVIVGGWIVWYWIRLGRVQVPRSRRTIRRYSLLAMTLSLIFFVRGLSFVDRVVEPRHYIVTWSLGMLMVMIVIVTAILDAINNLRLHQAHANAEVEQSTRELVQAIQKRRTAGQDSSNNEPLNGMREP